MGPSKDSRSGLHRRIFFSLESFSARSVLTACELALAYHTISARTRVLRIRIIEPVRVTALAGEADTPSGAGVVVLIAQAA
jgi:hypothetical protein